jgi:CRP-like cAMP-binding protein
MRSAPVSTLKTASRPADALPRRLAHLATLSPSELSIIRQTCATAEIVPAGTNLYAEGEPSTKPGAFVAGWGCRMRMLADGRRQIFDFFLPGDVFGLGSPPVSVAATSAITVTRAKIADVGCLREMIEQPERFPGLARAWERAQSLREAYLLSQIVRLGRQTAYERVAHLLLELSDRLTCLGCEIGAFVPLPLTQEMMADALGLSIVHVNRTLQQLRRDRMVETRAASIRLLKPHALAALADFRLPKVALRTPADIGLAPTQAPERTSRRPALSSS